MLGRRSSRNKYFGFRRYLIYLTDDLMWNHYNKKPPGGVFHSFINLPKNGRIKISPQFLRRQTKTFRKHLGSGFSAELRCCSDTELPQSFRMKIFEVL